MPDAVTPEGPAALPKDLQDGLAFLTSCLAKRIILRGRPALAIAETAQPFDDSQWFWTDDNAKALELLALPAVHDAEPDLADGVLDYVLAMSPGRQIWRRCGAAQLQLLRADPKNFRVVTPFHSFEGDLSRGILRQSVRFNDGRGRVAAVHTGNLVEFRLGGRKHCIDVEDSITGFGITRTAEGVAVYHESRIEAPRSLLARRPGPVLTLRYTYAIRADSAALRLTVEARPEPGLRLSALRVTTACDELSHRPQRLRLGSGGACHEPGLPEAGAGYVHRGPLDHLAIQEVDLAGFAHALHLRPHRPGRVQSVAVTTRAGGRPHWCVLRHDLGEPAPDGASVAEDRLLLAGSAPHQLDATAELLQAPETMAGIDPSLSYDYGAELNAVATYRLCAGAYAHPVPADRLEALGSWFDRHLREYLAMVAAPGGPQVFVRSLSFTMLALDTMLRATGEERYRLALGAMLDMLLQAQRSGPNDGLFLDSGRDQGYLDCHAAAVLALARLVRPGCDGRIVPALRRALLVLRPAAGQPSKGVAVMVRSRTPDGHWQQDDAFWTYKAALTLRALRAVLAHQASGLLPLAGSEWERIGDLARLCRDRLSETARVRPEGTEHLTSPQAGEANSETQAWALLAMAAPEAPLPGPARANRLEFGTAQG